MMLRVATDFHSVRESPSHAKTIVKASGSFGCWFSVDSVRDSIQRGRYTDQSIDPEIRVPSIHQVIIFGQVQNTPLNFNMEPKRERKRTLRHLKQNIKSSISNQFPPSNKLQKKTPTPLWPWVSPTFRLITAVGALRAAPEACNESHSCSLK